MKPSDGALIQSTREMELHCKTTYQNTEIEKKKKKSCQMQKAMKGKRYGHIIV